MKESPRSSQRPLVYHLAASPPHGSGPSCSFRATVEHLDDFVDPTFVGEDWKARTQCKRGPAAGQDLLCLGSYQTFG
jgi:hypothetical protein